MQSLYYAEVLVFSLYTISFFFILISFINFVKVILPEFEWRYIEIPATLIYNAFTFKNFFTKEKSWWVITKSVVAALISFATIASIQDYWVARF